MDDLSYSVKVNEVFCLYKSLTGYKTELVAKCTTEGNANLIAKLLNTHSWNKKERESEENKNAN